LWRGVTELDQVTYLLATDTDAFNGFTKTSSLADIRAEGDRMRKLWMSKELAAASTDADRARIVEQHAEFWKRLKINRDKRGDAPSESNIIHGLLMIYRTKRKAGSCQDLPDSNGSAYRPSE
jgi:hypothetical protein